MKIVNIMNFVRQIDERFVGSTDVLYETTKRELALINEFGFKATFLLQYDALCDERFVSLFRDNASESIELGIWYEIVEPLTTACDMPYRSERGWKWDWHIVPGFSMAYTPEERELLFDGFGLRHGLFAAAIFPFVMAVSTLLILISRRKKKASAEDNTNIPNC